MKKTDALRGALRMRFDERQEVKSKIRYPLITTANVGQQNPEKCNTYLNSKQTFQLIDI